MEIITGTTEFYLHRDTAVVIGKFDGVHIGHRRLLDEILEEKRHGLASCVFTFDPPPEVLFASDKAGRLTFLNTREEKRVLFERMGIDLLVEFPLDKESASMDPEIFLQDVLVGKLGACMVAAGPDLSYGAEGRGDLALLQKFATASGLEVHPVEKVRAMVDEQEKIVSSTLLRSLITEGRMEKAEELLGIPYPILGRVKHGRHLGHTLGFPTVNLAVPEGKLLPPYGVYRSDVVWRGKRYAGLSNVGRKPTVSDSDAPCVETYLYDFDGDLYEEEIEVYLKSFRRPERKFAGLEELKAQLQRDIENNRPGKYLS